jgi:biopolymer transport protein ExbB
MKDDIYISLFDSIPTWVMLVPIFICSVLALAIMIERSIYYRRIRHDYRSIVDSCAGLLKDRKTDEAKALCGRYNGPIARMLEKLIARRDNGGLDVSFVVDQSGHAIRTVERYLGLISTVATVSPMFGLFGTVTGMMKSFSALTKAGQFAHDLLARGIAEALVTTALGLLVAIPSLIFYNYMVSRVDDYIKDIEHAANVMQSISE